jgi:hypothetical protein
MRDVIEAGSVKAGPYANGKDGDEYIVTASTAEDVPEREGFGYVGWHSLGPKGGFYGGATFYTRERVDQFIEALAKARDHAFPKEA